MMVMPANNTGAVVRDLASRYPGAMGLLFSPGGQRDPGMMPYALDNGAFSAYRKGVPFDEFAWRRLLFWSINKAPRPPLWILVPDKVGDRDETLRLWDRWHRVAGGDRRDPLAFAVQDGMHPGDVPQEAAVVFVGGTTAWKRATAHEWCAKFPRVHVGRVNTYAWLRRYESFGAESCDGTGWFRGDKAQLDGLAQWLFERSGVRSRWHVPVEAGLFSAEDLAGGMVSQ